jgi:hypothetical protein
MQHVLVGKEVQLKLWKKHILYGREIWTLRKKYKF